MYDTGKGVTRGFHAHKCLQQILICIHGSCKIRLDNGKEKKVVPLEKPYEGLYVANNMWREMFDFSSDAVLMVLASELYDENTKRYYFPGESRMREKEICRNAEEMVQYYEELVEKFPLISIESISSLIIG